MSLFENFQLGDFDCPCCGKNWIKLEFIKALNDLQAEHPHKIKILSGYRCYDHNLKVGGARNSQHVNGNASDLISDDVESLYQLCMKKFMAVGDGRNRGFVHVDGRRDREHHWTY
jgi:uncharacterized protein YcbK (DUF882 family)